MDKTTNQYINQLKLDQKKEFAVRKLLENTGGVSDSTPVINSLNGDELIGIRQNGENKATSVESIKNEVLNVSKYEFVDLGLPSGVKWASCNVGANSPEDYGLYFAWGETQGYQVTNSDGFKILDANGNEQTDKSGFTWGDYELCEGSYSTLKKYCTRSSYGTVDNLDILQTTDDAAYQSDNICRMPTTDEFQELCNTAYTDGGKWVTNYNGSGVNGVLFTSKSNGNSVFFPAAGYVRNGSLRYAGSNVLVWSSSLDTSYPSSAYVLDALGSKIYIGGSYDRFYGQSVRPVQSANVKSTIDLKELKETVDNLEIQAKDAKEVFIITVDMFEETSTAQSEQALLTFTDDGWNKLLDAVKSNKIIGIDYLVTVVVTNWAVPFDVLREKGYFILNGLIYYYNGNNIITGISSYLSFINLHDSSPSVYMINMEDKYLTSNVANVPSEIYYLNIGTYSTANDFYNLKYAIEDNKYIVLNKDGVQSAAFVLNNTNDKITLGFNSVFPDNLNAQNIQIQYGAYVCNYDGTITDITGIGANSFLLQKSGDGTKFLADDGSYKEVSGGTSSVTVDFYEDIINEYQFNYLQTGINNRQRIILSNANGTYQCIKSRIVTSDETLELVFLMDETIATYEVTKTAINKTIKIITTT